MVVATPVMLTPCASVVLLCVVLSKVTTGERIDFGLEYSDELRAQRTAFEQSLAKNSENKSYYEHVFVGGNTEVRIQVKKDVLTFYDDDDIRRVNFTLIYNSSVPLLIFYDTDSPHEVNLTNRLWYLFPATSGVNHIIPVDIEPWQIGLSYFRFWINEAVPTNSSELNSLPFNSSINGQHLDYVAIPPKLITNNIVLGFPLVVLRGKGIVQLVFRIVVVSMVTLFMFTMGCELDPQLLKAYLRRPVGPAIGLCCQFVIMPIVSFTIAYLVPIRREFGFGLLTIGCSPGGGASNGWALTLGGDINLSILMTFISSFSALFMMPFFLFVFGRFFIDVHRVQIPYANICIQLLQLSLPTVAGLGLRCWKPNVAKTLMKLTRPMFLFFILFFLTFGIYANWSIFRLLGTYPIVMPTGALLPWLGFLLAALFAFILRQPRPIIITVALETGIQNIGAAILVLLYSMPQPAGDLGAIMPIVVSIFTPIPLCFILLGVTIKKRCCSRRQGQSIIEEVGDSVDGKAPVVKEDADVVDGLLKTDNGKTRF